MKAKRSPVLALAAAVAVSVGVGVGAGAAQAKPRTLKCGNVTGYGGQGVADHFTKVRATGISCKATDYVLKVYSGSGPGGTIKGFACSARATRTQNVFDVTCKNHSKRITAINHVKR
jgi:hypothetical protein